MTKNLPATVKAAIFAAPTIALLLAACASSSSPVVPSLTPAQGYGALISSTEFVVGENRFPFGLISDDGRLLENAQVQVRYYLLAQEPKELRGEAPAKFHTITAVAPHQHPDGQLHEHVEVRGLYIIEKANFDTKGFWGAEFVATGTDGQRIEIPMRAFEVKEKSIVPFIGDQAPPSRNLTLADVSIEQIESRVPPDDMHELSVAQALELGKPFIVVFATPMFCVTRMCGPVTDVAAALHDRYRGRVNFIHIEPWDLNIARSEGRLVPIDVVSEWNLPTEPWVFVVDQEGRVAARFEGLVTSEELENAITSVLP